MRIRRGKHVARSKETKNAYSILVGRSEGKRPCRRPRCKSEYNIKLDCREINCDGMKWNELAQDGVQG